MMAESKNCEDYDVVGQIHRRSREAHAPGRARRGLYKSPSLQMGGSTGDFWQLRVRSRRGGDMSADHRPVRRQSGDRAGGAIAPGSAGGDDGRVLVTGGAELRGQRIGRRPGPFRDRRGRDSEACCWRSH